MLILLLSYYGQLWLEMISKQQQSKSGGYTPAIYGKLGQNQEPWEVVNIPT